MSVPGKEAERIYHAIFNKKIPASIQTHFNIISKKIDGRFTGAEVKKYYECIEKVRDLEALEIAARYFKKLPILTEKFNIMVYLSETLPENYTVFVNEQSKCFLAYILLISSLFRSGYKAAKGVVILAANRI
jgi:hypothetical protein